ncbi:uncharacterized protein LOC141528439 [Cotesia typhae]|uniref:uncharacterized protein LOC141528439 n=1 Tax=Cotesia typhae TaxID=2053667 RepID=UPI003D699F13
MVRVMQQWQRKICPPTPTSLVTNVYGRDGSIATVFIDPDFLENVQTTNLYIDATYKVCPTTPKNIYQFFTIMASINNSILPVTWSLMSRKSTDCYVAVIDRFKSLSQHIIVLSYMTDFESGLRKALKLSYPNAPAESCYFHFIQANMKKAKKLGLLKKLENWEDGRKFFRKLLALALLPSTDIIPTFNWLLVIHTPSYLIFKDFLNYFVDYWLMTIKPDGFCIGRSL